MIIERLAKKALFCGSSWISLERFKLFRTISNYRFRTFSNSRLESLLTRSIQSGVAAIALTQISSLDSNRTGTVRRATKSAHKPNSFRGASMSKVKAPRSLRFEAAINSVNQTIENNSGKTVSAVAGLIAVASFSGAEAQQSNLPPVTVDAPVARPRPAAARPSADQIRARTALRRAAPRRSRAGRRRCRSPMPVACAPTVIPTQIRTRPTWPPGCRRQASFPSRSSTRPRRSRC